MPTAYIDESQPGGTGSGGPYLLAATMLLDEESDAENIRWMLRGALPKGQKKIHWSESVPAFRASLVDKIAQWDLIHRVVVRDAQFGERPERARRSCIEELLYELDQRRVERAVFESRGPADDRRDREMLSKLRARKTVRGPLRMEHVRGHEEPLLWLPDIACGAVGQRLRGNDLYANGLGHQMMTEPMWADHP